MSYYVFCLLIEPGLITVIIPFYTPTSHMLGLVDLRSWKHFCVQFFNFNISSSGEVVTYCTLNFISDWIDDFRELSPDSHPRLSGHWYNSLSIHVHLCVCACKCVSCLMVAVLDTAFRGNKSVFGSLVLVF